MGAKAHPVIRYVSIAMDVLEIIQWGLAKKSTPADWTNYWRLDRTCKEGNPNHWIAANTSNTVCLTLQNPLTANMNVAPYSFQNLILTFDKYWVEPWQAYRSDELARYVRIGPGTVPAPSGPPFEIVTFPYPVPTPVRGPVELWPPEPRPRRSPLPWTRPTPVTEPPTDPAADPDPHTDPRPIPIGNPFPDIGTIVVVPGPGFPNVIPEPVGVVITPNPGPGGPDDGTVDPEPGTNPGPLPPTPYTPRGGGMPGRPEPGTKEKKVNIRTVGGGIPFVLIDGAFGAVELIDNAYSTLPDKCKLPKYKRNGKAIDPFDKAEAVYNCFDHIDWAKVVEVWLNDKIEDFIIGQVGGIGADLNRLTGSVTGGYRALTGHWEDGTLPIPQLNVDMENRTVSLTF